MTFFHSDAYSDILKSDTFVPNEKLAEYALGLASGIIISGYGRISGIIRKIRDDLNYIKKTANFAAHIWAEAETKGSGESSQLPKEIQWLLDNWYIAEREGKSAAIELKKRGKFRTDADGSAVIYTAAHETVLLGRGKIDEERIELFLNGFQKKVILILNMKA